MRRTLFRVISTLSLVTLAVCTESGPLEVPAPSDQPQRTTSCAPGSPGCVSVDAEIERMITEMFPGGLVTATNVRWGTVKEKLSTDPVLARRKLVELVDYIGRKTPDITVGTTIEDKKRAAGRLVAHMVMYVEGLQYAPAAALPAPGADATFAIIQPDQAALVETPSDHAAFQSRAGTFNETTIAVITQDLRTYARCEGPLDTTLCQYPPFYQFEFFPQMERFNFPVRFAVCWNTSGEPGADAHDRWRLAHELPPPAGRIEGGTVRDNIEILPPSGQPASDLVTCPSTASSVGTNDPNGVVGLWDTGGPDGFANHDSFFGGVDPGPDYTVDGAPTATPSTVYQGETVEVAFVARNVGLLAGQATTAEIYLSTDAVITPEDVKLTTESPVEISALEAGATEARTARATIPLATAPGSYHIGPYIVPTNDADNHVEAQLTNNAASTPITVAPPEVHGVTVTPGSASTPVGGQRQFAAIVTGRGNFPTSVLWSSSNVDVATISSDGLATGQRIGGVRIVATSTADATKQGVATLKVVAVINNGTVQLGVNPTGELNVFEAGTPSAETGTTTVGLRYMPTNHDAAAPGCACEGWGVADAGTLVTGSANRASGRFNVFVELFDATSREAKSIVRIGSTFRVTHHYRPSELTPNLYQVTVLIENISGRELADVRYRRTIDWDVEPTAFRDVVTIQGSGGAANVLYASDNGFALSDPLANRSFILFEGDAVNSGPTDHGAMFDLGFGSLPVGGSRQFLLYYGAAGNEADALVALRAVGAEVYSLGKPETDPTIGTPNTFVLAFSGVGGGALTSEQVAPMNTDVQKVRTVRPSAPSRRVTPPPQPRTRP